MTYLRWLISQKQSYMSIMENSCSENLCNTPRKASSKKCNFENGFKIISSVFVSFVIYQLLSLQHLTFSLIFQLLELWRLETLKVLYFWKSRLLFNVSSLKLTKRLDSVTLQILALLLQIDFLRPTCGAS